MDELNVTELKQTLEEFSWQNGISYIEEELLPLVQLPKLMKNFMKTSIQYFFIVDRIERLIKTEKGTIVKYGQENPYKMNIYDNFSKISLENGLQDNTIEINLNIQKSSINQNTPFIKFGNSTYPFKVVWEYKSVELEDIIIKYVSEINNDYLLEEIIENESNHESMTNPVLDVVQYGKRDTYRVVSGPLRDFIIKSGHDIILQKVLVNVENVEDVEKERDPTEEEIVLAGSYGISYKSKI